MVLAYELGAMRLVDAELPAVPGYFNGVKTHAVEAPEGHAAVATEAQKRPDPAKVYLTLQHDPFVVSLARRVGHGLGEVNAAASQTLRSAAEAVPLD